MNFNAISPRIAVFTLKTTNKIYSIINAHAPTNEKKFLTKNMQEVEDFCELLDQTMNQLSKNNIKILIGDFNAQL